MNFGAYRFKILSITSLYYPISRRFSSHKSFSMAEFRPRKRVIELLSPEAPQAKRQRLPNSCEWIIREAAFKQWVNKSANPPLLWITGPPGCGKSFLAQYIVEQTPGPVISYFCSQHSTPGSIMRSVLAQLLEHPSLELSIRDDLVGDLEGLLETSSGIADNTFKLWDKFKVLSQTAPNFSLVIDGLDELPDEKLGEATLDLPSRLLQAASYENPPSLLVLSRDNSKLRSRLSSYTTIQITAEKVREDLAAFIETEVGQYENFRGDREKITASLLKQSDGIFLWAKLSIKLLSLEDTRSKVQSRLKNLSISLDDVYAQLLEQTRASLSEPDILLRDHTLSWVCNALRPLSPPELANIMLLEVSQETFSPAQALPDFAQKASDVCASLIKFENGTLRPMHPSLSEFLQRSKDGSAIRLGLNVDESNTGIARACLTYLSDRAFGEIPFDPGNLASYDFLEYAALYWPYHLSLASKSDEGLRSLILSFFQSRNAFTWIDALLPLFLSQSVLPVPPRPINSARFAYFFANRSYIVNFFDGDKKHEVDRRISTFIQNSYENELERAGEQYGVDSLQALQRSIDLAEIYGWLPDKNQQAQALLEDALQISLPPSNPASATMSIALLQTLADIHKRTGNYASARSLLNKLLALAKDALPPTDPRIMAGLDSLGWVYMRLGKPYQSAGLLAQAMNIAVAHYGIESPMALRSKVTLAEVFGKLGRLAEAEKLCAELKRQIKEAAASGAAEKKKLPRDSVSQLNTLAAVYMQQGKLGKAAETFEMVVEDRRSMFGAEHPMTLWATMQLAKVRKDSGEKETARELLKELMPKQEKVLGKEHPDSKDASQMLAVL